MLFCIPHIDSQIFSHFLPPVAQLACGYMKMLCRNEIDVMFKIILQNVSPTPTPKKYIWNKIKKVQQTSKFR